MRALNLDQLRTFAEVVARGSFSGAAIRLGLTQPAVSLQVRNLERRLGVRLIERVGKRALPTAAGHDLVSFARRLEEEADAALAHMHRHRKGGLGRVRVGTGATACTYLLPPVLAALRTARPGLEIVVMTGNTAEMLAAVEDNALDLALVTLPAARRSLILREVLDDPLVAVLPLSDRDAPERLGPQDFAGRPLILYERRGATRAVIDAWLVTGGFQPRPTMELGNVEAIKNLVAIGLGSSILPSVTVAEERQGHRLLVRPLAPALSRTLGLALRQDKVIDGALRAMIEALEELGNR